MRIAIAVLAFVLSISALTLRSQGAATFEVASVRPDDSRRAPGIRVLPNGQFTAAAVTLHDLIMRAYGVHESQVIGGQGWVTSDRYEVVAKASGPPPGGTADVLTMLQTLLAERFRLRMRTESRPLSAYVVTMRVNGRLGPGIRVSTVDCAANMPSPVPSAMTLTADGWPPCGLTLTRTWLGDTRVRAEVKQSAVSMREFAFRLQGLVGRPVVDRTDLSGLFDIEYVYVRDTAANTGGIPAAPADAPDLFTAFDRQLGMRIESDRVEVPVLVIDSVERASAN
jgi:uncharacterized protein (TIGR03435 family)